MVLCPINTGGKSKLPSLPVLDASVTPAQSTSTKRFLPGNDVFDGRKYVFTTITKQLIQNLF